MCQGYAVPPCGTAWPETICVPSVQNGEAGVPQSPPRTMLVARAPVGCPQRYRLRAWHTRGHGSHGHVHKRRCMAVSRASNSVAAELADLKAALAEAVAEEDYSRAAQLRDHIRDIESSDPETVLRSELNRATKEERFEDAALLKAKLVELQQSTSSVTAKQLAGKPTQSEACTEGIRVSVSSYYVPDASQPEEERYLFAYHCTIKNTSARTVKLVERYWEVTNDRGQIHELRGEGVVGRQPELAPGQSFVYQATCPLSTPVGAMKGHYEMYVKNEASGKWTSSFLAEIAPFGLDSRS